MFVTSSLHSSTIFSFNTVCFFRRIKIIDDARGNDDSVMTDPVYVGYIPASEFIATLINNLSII